MARSSLTFLILSQLLFSLASANADSDSLGSAHSSASSRTLSSRPFALNSRRESARNQSRIPPTFAMTAFSPSGIQGFCNATAVAKRKLPKRTLCEIVFLSAAHCFYFPSTHNFVYSAIQLGKLRYPVKQTSLELTEDFKSRPFSQTPGETDAALLRVVDKCTAVPDSALVPLAKPNSRGNAPVMPGDNLLIRNRDGSVAQGSVQKEPWGRSRAWAIQLTSGVQKPGISGSILWNRFNQIVGVVSVGSGSGGSGKVSAFSAKGLAWIRSKLDARAGAGLYTATTLPGTITDSDKSNREVANVLTTELRMR